jgi:hypothetical protein
LALDFKSRLIGTFFILILLPPGACNRNIPVSDKDKEAFINTVVDLVLMMDQPVPAKGKQPDGYETLFARHGTSEEFLYDFIDKISSHPEVQREIFQTISDRLKKYRDLPPDSLRRIIKSLAVEP